MSSPNPGDKKFGSLATRSIREQESSAAESPKQATGISGAKIAEQAISHAVPGGKAAMAFKNRLNKKSSGPIAAVTGVIIAMLMLFSSTVLPGLSIIKPAMDLINDLDTQLGAVDKVNGQLWSAKINKTAKGCGTIKINCRFKTVDMKKTTDNFNRHGIKVEFETDEGYANGRGQIKSLEYTDNKGRTVLVKEASQLSRAMRTNIGFRTAMINANNPKFLSFNDSPAHKALARLKTSYSSKLHGTTTEELDNSLKKAVQTRGSISIASLRPEIDDDGNETGRYLNEEGEAFSKEEYDGLKETENRMKNATPTKSLVQNAAKGVMITGAADTACMAYTLGSAVEQAAKIYRAAELSRFAQATILGLSGEIKAGDASPEKVQYISNKLAEPDLRETVIDETSLKNTGVDSDPPMRINPNKGKTGLDSEFYKLSTYQEMPRITTDNEQFLVSGGRTGVLANTMQNIRSAMGGASHDTITRNCRVIQHPVTQGGAFVVGVVVGAVSLGTSTAVLMGASLLLGMATPYLFSMLGDMIAGRVTGHELTGTQMMDAAAIGTDHMMNEQAKARGLMPIPKDEMVDYQNLNREVGFAYQEHESRLAASRPFDVYNPYSLMGSTMMTLLPTMMTARQASISSLAAIPQLLGTALSSFQPKAIQANSLKVKPERYEQTFDTIYSQHDVAVNPSGVLVYGLPKKAMDMTPEEAAEWMVANGEIDPEDETGAPLDNDKSWNYKKYVETCVNGDTTGDCMSQANYEANLHYAKFHLAVEWNKVIDGDVPGLTSGAANALGTGQSGSVNPDGWAFPTTDEAILTSGFGPRGGEMHRGIDLAQPGDATGKPIFAAREGEVIASGPADGFGNWIVIKHEVDGRRYDSVYGHMFSDGLFVRVGDSVTAGQEIGAIGNSGQSTGPHLHFEIWDGGHHGFVTGSAIDPEPIVGRGAS